MSRTMVALAALAWLGVLAAVVRVAPGSTVATPELRVPLLLGLLACLLLVLSLGWIGIYLNGTGRVLRDFARRPELGAELAREAEAHPAVPWPWWAAGVLAAVGVFVMCIERAGGRLELLPFGGLVSAGLVLVAGLLVRAFVVLGRRDRLLAAVDRAVGR